MPARYEDLDWYETPAAYDALFADGTRREADFLEAALARHGRAAAARRAASGSAPRVLEPACGSGRLVAELARRGARVTGFDRSRAMLDYARARLARRGLAARLFEADMADFETAGRFELAHCLVSTFKYLDSERAARAHLARVAERLVPGGLYVLGFHLSEYGEGARVERWQARRGRSTITSRAELAAPDRARRRERVRLRLSVAAPGGVRRSETRFWFRTYDEREVRRLLAAVPELELAAVHDFDYRIDRPGRLDGPRLDQVLVLRRRAEETRPRSAWRSKRSP